MPKQKVKKKTLAHDLFDIPLTQGGINSKVKGNTNEVACCKWLKKWTDQRFIRVPSSGGRRLENNSNFCGDVVVENQDFNFLFSVETKHLGKKGSATKTIWEQCKRDADRAGKLGMLMLRYNGMPNGTYTVWFEGTKIAGILQLFDVNYTYVVDNYLFGYNSDELLKAKYTELLPFIRKL